MDNEIYHDHRPEITPLIILIILLLLILIGLSTFGLRIERKGVSAPTETASKLLLTTSLRAKSAYVYDARTKTVLFAKNEDTRLPLASLTKIMSALVANDISPSYGVITISNEALKTEGESGLYINERWSLKDLIDFSLVTSSNDGIRAIALSLGALSRVNATPQEIVDDFVKEMNQKALELDLTSTYFWNETGLDESEAKSGAYGTAKDMNTLLEHILTNNPELFSATKEGVTAFRSLDNRVHIARNTNSVISQIPGLLVSKTGLTDTAGGNLVLIFDPELGRPIIITILGSTEQARFQDAEVLIKALMRYLDND